MIKSQYFQSYIHAYASPRLNLFNLVVTNLAENIFFFSFYSLEVEAGQFSDSEILVMLGENGTGKTTFIRMLAGKLEPDAGSADIPVLNISYKPQKISPKSQNTVQHLLHEKIRDFYIHPQFIADVMRPLNINELIDQEVRMKYVVFCCYNHLGPRFLGST